MTFQIPSYVCFANARPAVPFFMDGGAERTTKLLVTELAARGVEVLQLSILPRGGIAEAAAKARNLNQSYASGHVFHIPQIGLTISTIHESLIQQTNHLTIIAVHLSDFEPILLKSFTQVKPSLLVTWLTGSDFVVRLGTQNDVPTILRIVGPDTTEGYPVIEKKIVVLANSPLTAQVSAAHYKCKVPFLLELIDYGSYVCSDRKPLFVTLINPRREKGIHLFTEIARRALHIPFLVVMGWSQSSYSSDEKRALEYLQSLPNISWRAEVADMREVYSITRLLLLPSRWPESWARVVGEAQCNGIPILASDRGSTPYQMGDGGVILPYGQPRLWAELIHQLYEDGGLLDELGKNAKQNTDMYKSVSTIDDYLRFFSDVAFGTEKQKSPTIGNTQVLLGQSNHSGKLQFTRVVLSADAVIDCSEPSHR